MKYRAGEVGRKRTGQRRRRQWWVERRKKKLGRVGVKIKI